MLDMGKEFQDTGFEFGNLAVFLTEKIHAFFLRQGLQISSLDASQKVNKSGGKFRTRNLPP